MKYIIILLFVLPIFACSSDRIIKDKDLELILHDMFVQNAYTKTAKMRFDSLNIYEPIFRKYGYKEEDMLRTLTIFSRRKSSRFSQVLDKVGITLDRERDHFKNRVDVADTIINIAERRYGTLVYSDSAIVFNKAKIKEKERLKLNMAAKAGKYVITYHYKFDSVKTNFSAKATFFTQDSLGEKLENTETWLNSSNIKGVELTVIAPEGTDSLKGNYMGVSNSHKFKTLTIDSVKVMYYLPEKVALDSMYREFMNYELLIDSLSYDKLPQDISSLGADTTGLEIKADSIN